MAEITTITVKTTSKTELIDITPQVGKTVANSGVKEGVAFIFSPHTTCGLTINENADPSVRRDIVMILNEIVPWKANYSHLEGNSPAHIKTILVGNSLTVLIGEGRLVLGTWQGIFLAEFDGPRTRKVLVRPVSSE